MKPRLRAEWVVGSWTRVKRLVKRASHHWANEALDNCATQLASQCARCVKCFCRIWNYLKRSECSCRIINSIRSSASDALIIVHSECLNLTCVFQVVLIGVAGYSKWILLVSMETAKGPRFPNICLPFGQDKQCSVSIVAMHVFACFKHWRISSNIHSCLRSEFTLSTILVTFRLIFAFNPALLVALNR